MLATLSRMGRPRKEEKSATVRIPASVLKRIKRAALHRGVEPGDYIARAVSSRLKHDEREMLEKLQNEQQQG